MINLANIGLFDAVFDLSGLFNRYPSYQQRPYYSGQGGFGQGGFYPGGYSSQGGFGSYPGTGSGSYPGTGSGLGTNILGKKKLTSPIKGSSAKVVFLDFIPRRRLW